MAMAPRSLEHHVCTSNGRKHMSKLERTKESYVSRRIMQ